MIGQVAESSTLNSEVKERADVKNNFALHIPLNRGYGGFINMYHRWSSAKVIEFYTGCVIFTWLCVVIIVASISIIIMKGVLDPKIMHISTS